MTRPAVDWDDDYSAPRRRWLSGRGILRLSGWGLVTLVVGVLLYYAVGGFLMNAIDDDSSFKPSEVPTGGSKAVAVAADLIDREVNQHFWVSNDPFFYPSAWLDNTPNYQQGIIYALSRFAVEMTDQIGRTRGSSEADADLDMAAGLLKFPGNVWVYDLSTSFLPTASSESQYRAARRALLAYNQRLVSGHAIFERRADNLLGTIERIAADLGSASATVDQHLAQSRSMMIDTRVDDIFYGVKGRLYGYYLLLAAIGEDFEPVLKEKQLASAWAQMLDSLRQAAVLDPLMVVNGAPDGLFFPSHLSVQGFYLLRARTQLREISSILLR